MTDSFYYMRAARKLQQDRRETEEMAFRWLNAQREYPHLDHTLHRPAILRGAETTIETVRRDLER